MSKADDGGKTRIDVHADQLDANSSYSRIAGQTFHKFDPTAQDDDALRKHTVTIGKTADASKGLMQFYQQMGLSHAEFSALKVKP